MGETGDRSTPRGRMSAGAIVFILLVTGLSVAYFLVWRQLHSPATEARRILNSFRTNPPEPGVLQRWLRLIPTDEGLAGQGMFRGHEDVGEDLAGLGEDVVATLVEALSDPDPDIRAAATVGLGRIGPDAAGAIPVLVGLLDNQSATCRGRGSFLPGGGAEVGGRAAEALGGIGQASVPELTKALADANPVVRKRAAWALGLVGPPAAPAVGALVAALKDPVEDVRFRATHALAGIGPAAVKRVARALEDPDEDTRHRAAIALEQMDLAAAEAIADPAVASVLIRALGDRSKKVRTYIVRTLGRLGPTRPWADDATPALTACLKDADPYIRVNAAEALVELGQADVGLPALCRELKDPDGRHWAAQSLRLLGTAAKPALEDLLAALDDNRPEGRADIAEALTRLGRADVGLPALIGMLKTTEEWPVKDALSALSSLGPVGRSAEGEIARIAQLAEKAGPGDPLFMVGTEALTALASVKGKPEEAPKVILITTPP